MTWIVLAVVVIGIVAYVSRSKPREAPPVPEHAGPSEDDIVQAREGFTLCCSLLGSGPEAIREVLGSPTEHTTNEYGTQFLFYDSHQSLFTVDGDTLQAKYVSWPHMNAHGTRPPMPAVGQPSLLGIKLGDRRETVRGKWGDPTVAAERVWMYSNLQGSTESGDAYELTVAFRDDGGTVEGIEARLVDSSHFA